MRKVEVERKGKGRVDERERRRGEAGEDDGWKRFRFLGEWSSGWLGSSCRRA